MKYLAKNVYLMGYLGACQDLRYGLERRMKSIAELAKEQEPCICTSIGLQDLFKGHLEALKECHMLIRELEDSHKPEDI